MQYDKNSWTQTEMEIDGEIGNILFRRNSNAFIATVESAYRDTDNSILNNEKGRRQTYNIMASTKSIDGYEVIDICDDFKKINENMYYLWFDTYIDATYSRMYLVFSIDNNKVYAMGLMGENKYNVLQYNNEVEDMLKTLK